MIRETGREVLGMSSGQRKEDKETWCWNSEFQESVQRKRLAKQRWDSKRTVLKVEVGLHQGSELKKGQIETVWCVCVCVCMCAYDRMCSLHESIGNVLTL